jgi:hypothetical protein
MSHPTPPNSLWLQNILYLPTTLVEAYRQELSARQLLEEAAEPRSSDKELFDGKDSEDAVKHFTRRFKTSAARVQFVAIDPSGTFRPVSAALLAALFDGPMAILDIPCGSGGGLFGLLDTVAELRRSGTLPRTPTSIQILAADKLEDARVLHQAMYSRLAPSLLAVGVRSSVAYRHWDVTDDLSTAELMTAWRQQADRAEVYLVFVSAFSGFAAKGQNSEKVLQAFRDIALRLHDRHFLIVWIEPMINESKRFLPRLVTWFTGLYKSRPVATDDGMDEEFQYRHPFNDEVLTGRARVVKFQQTET